MDRIAIAGVSIHGTDVSGLECWRRPEPGRENAFLRELSDALGASELVFLGTCNRVEVIFAREEGEQPDVHDLSAVADFLSASQRPPGEAGASAEDGAAAADRPANPFRLRTGRDAVQHLFRVACSLDSLMLGEDQIIAQVRSSYGRSADIGLVGPLLGPLFHHALAIGKRVRSDTDLARHPVSIVNLAILALGERVDRPDPAVAVVGAGEMGHLVVRALQSTGRSPACIVNRTLAAAQELAAECGAPALELDAFRSGAHPVDVIMSATSAPGVVLDADTLRALAPRTPSGAPLLGIDLAVPRDLAEVHEASVDVIDLDALRTVADRNRALRAEAASAAERLVDSKVETFARRFREDAAAPVVTELRQSSEELLVKELRGLLTGRLAHLAEVDQRAVERWARATFGRLMHLPVTALKRMAFEMLGDPAGTDDVDAEDAERTDDRPARPDANRDADDRSTVSRVPRPDVAS